MTASRPSFDWRRIHAELNARHLSGRTSFADDAARRDAILRDRTAQLAAVPLQRARGSVSTDFLIFRAAGGLYALALAAIREVVASPAIASVPGAAEIVHGVMSWRGEFATIFNLAPALGLPRGGDEVTSAIMLRRDAPRIALAIEGAERTAHLDAADIRAANAQQAPHGDLVHGLTADAVLVLNERGLAARLSEELRDA